ncbi:MAG: hypothetical protein ACO3F2_06600 [Roseiflexaceae bacterium]
MSDTPSTLGIVVTAEQIPLLRDIIVAYNLHVYISDTQDTVLLDGQWKPWIRRVRPQRTHCTGEVWLLAPCYSWPDQQSHPRIRTIIAEQLQSCIQMAVMLGATGLVLPIEHAQSAFIERLTYYLNLIDDQLKAHNLALMLAIPASAMLQDVAMLCTHLLTQHSLLLDSTHTYHELDHISECTYVGQIACEDDETTLPSWTHHVIIGANEHVSQIRQKVQWVHEQRAQQLHSDTDEQMSAEPSSLDSADDEIA